MATLQKRVQSAKGLVIEWITSNRSNTTDNTVFASCFFLWVCSLHGLDHGHPISRYQAILQQRIIEARTCLITHHTFELHIPFSLQKFVLLNRLHLSPCFSLVYICLQIRAALNYNSIYFLYCIQQIQHQHRSLITRWATLLFRWVSRPTRLLISTERP